MNDKDLPVRKTMCGTCPFRPESKYAYLAPDLAISAISNTSRICHSTGSNNAINRRTGIKPHICRGSRDIQISIFVELGFLNEATDEAWNAKRVAIGMKPQIIQNPRRV